MSTKKLIEKIKENSYVKSTIFSETDIFDEPNPVQTSVPILNLALGGHLNGGLKSGLLLLAGPSKHFKSLLALIMMKAFFDQRKDAVCIFYDSEFGTRPNYFETIGIDSSKVIHKPLTTIEDLKYDISKSLEIIEKGDNVIVLVDSIGNLASKKEAEDAGNQHAAVDMTRQKEIGSVMRIVTPHLMLKKIPMIMIAHTYDTMSFISQTVISGGKKMYYAANDAWIITRSQEKDDNELAGYKFTINIDKSREVVEKSKFPFIVLKKTGMQRYSGMLDIALDLGFVEKPAKGYYSRVIEGKAEEKRWREKQTNTKDFWDVIMTNPEFNEAIKQKYSLGSHKIFNDSDSDIEE